MFIWLQIFWEYSTCHHETSPRIEIYSASLQIYSVMEGRNEGFYLTMHSTHFIYGYMMHQTYIMVKDYSDSERANLLLPHGLFFLINSKVFYMHHPTGRIALNMTFVAPIMEHWLEWKIAPWAKALTTELYLAPIEQSELFTEQWALGLLIGKSSLCGSSGFPLSLSEWSFTICLMP